MIKIEEDGITVEAEAPVRFKLSNSNIITVTRDYNTLTLHFDGFGYLIVAPKSANRIEVRTE